MQRARGGRSRLPNWLFATLVTTGTGLISILLVALLAWAALSHWRSDDPYQKDPKYAGYFRLLAAIEANDFSAVSRELDSGTDPNLIPPCDQWEDDFAPLSAAAGDGCLVLVCLLLWYGADPNQEDGWSYNPLTAAAVGNHVDVMRLLVQSGARVQEEHFSIALWLAAVEGKKEAVAFLLAHGADSDEKGDDGRPLREVVEQFGHRDVAALLASQPAGPVERR